MLCASGTVDEETNVKECGATVRASARDDQTTDNMMRYKNTSIHVAHRSFYLKLVHIKHHSRQFHWNCPVMSNIYVTALLKAYTRYFFHREGISIELFLVTCLLVNKLQQHLVLLS